MGLIPKDLQAGANSRQKLDAYLEAACLPEADGLDCEALNKDSEVISSHIIDTIRQIYIGCDREAELPNLEKATRTQLVEFLAETLEMEQVSTLFGNASVVSPTRHNQKTGETFGDNGIVEQKSGDFSRRAHDRAIGIRSNVNSARSMRNLRNRFGWQSANAAGIDIHTPHEKAAFANIKKRFIENLVAKGIARDAAETSLQTEYISTDIYYKPREYDTDPLVVNKRLIQFSPEAQKDFFQELLNIKSLEARRREEGWKGPGAAHLHHSGPIFKCARSKRVLKRMVERYIAHAMKHGAGKEEAFEQMQMRYMTLVPCTRKNHWGEMSEALEMEFSPKAIEDYQHLYEEDLKRTHLRGRDNPRALAHVVLENPNLDEIVSLSDHEGGFASRMGKTERLAARRFDHNHHEHKSDRGLDGRG